MKKLFLIIICACAVMACKVDNGDYCQAVLKFPEAGYYDGELTQVVGENSTSLQLYVEMHNLGDGAYSLMLLDSGADTQYESHSILFRRLNGEFRDGVLVLAGENISAMINSEEFVFASLMAELTADKATLLLDFDGEKVWRCDIDALHFKLE